MVHTTLKTVADLISDLDHSERRLPHTGPGSEHNLRHMISRIATHALRYTRRNATFHAKFPGGLDFDMPWYDARQGIVNAWDLGRHPMFETRSRATIARWIEILAGENRNRSHKREPPMYKFYRAQPRSCDDPSITIAEVRDTLALKECADPGAIYLQVRL